MTGAGSPGTGRSRGRRRWARAPPSPPSWARSRPHSACGPMARIGEDGEPSRRHAFETDGERPWRPGPAARARGGPRTGGGSAPCSATPRAAGGGRAERFLGGFWGRRLQCDGYEGYERLTRIARPEGPWTLVHRWSHLRRRVKRVARATRSPVAEEALTRIGALHAVEKAVRGRPPEVRLAARRGRSAPVVGTLKPRLEAQLSPLSSGSKLAGRIRLAPCACGTG